MEWLRKYGSWFIGGLLLLSIVARFLAVQNNNPRLPPLELPMQDTSSLGKAKQQMWESMFSSWKKETKGDDSDTLLLPYYDSMLAHCDNPFILSGVREELGRLHSIREKRVAESLLPGTWKLVWQEEGKLKKETFVFHDDHTLSWLKNGKERYRDTFEILRGNDAIELEIYEHEKERPEGLHHFYTMSVTKDTLSFLYNAQPPMVFEKYVREK